MNFLRPLICLVASLSLQAQTLELQAKGGGELKIGATSYRFALTDLSTAPAKGGLSGALKLTGNLVPKDGSAGTFHMTLIVLKSGGLYTLRIERRNGKAYPDSWAATLKTKTRALKLEDRPGGRVEIQCEGPLTGVIAQRPTQADWSGTLWAVFPGETEVATN
ncbi:hypothetical protein GETHLI_09040 [Geothrix limicola]|uniref:Uncharacterized protein n=1 Tax=Geothrix limicola TaxID=2927978 RepID=A0ABQ5QCJ9_9BACT|nr:hypothetical protein [Geothrix limicola]GLH72402.1 hypothetical protein GETHLI_09040 [Geothrix limicola]